MQTIFMQTIYRICVRVLLTTASATFFISTPSSAQTLGATALQQKRVAISAQLAQNQFKRPILLDSSESKNSVTGNVYAVIDSRFTTVSDMFKDPSRWCDVFILHLNTKGCTASALPGGSKLVLHVGKKNFQELKDATQLEFSYRHTAFTAGYSAAELQAEQGPLGTKNYKIEIEAVPLPEGKTFLHLQYGYTYGNAAKFAMQGYMATVAKGKVGFTPLNESGNELVGGVRGSVERNTMRYYLAIDAYLSSLNVPEAQQEQTRLSKWFDSTEQYARQLREISRSEYLTMKREELARQQSKLAK